MILVLPVYMRAILKAASFASVPEVVKKNLFSPFGQNFEQKLRQFGACGRGVTGQSVREVLRLFRDGVDDGLVLVPEVHAHELRGEVEIALAVGVDEVAAFGVDDVQWVPALLKAPGAVVGLASDAGPLLLESSRCGMTVSLFR